VSPGDILAGVVLASVPVWSLKAALVLALVPAAGALLFGLFLVFGRRGGE
jgi:hypothetical protein